MIGASEQPASGAGYRGSASVLRYLIVRSESTRVDALTLLGGEVLPVFETEGATLAFLRSGGLTGGWRVRETTPGELISLLVGHLPHVGLVVLEPTPGVLAEGAERRSMPKREFVAALMGEHTVAYAR
jgi:hypothetical protein